MPELPEVEIVRQSLNKKINQKRVIKVIIRNRNLRFLIPNNFKSYIKRCSKFNCVFRFCLGKNWQRIRR